MIAFDYNTDTGNPSPAAGEWIEVSASYTSTADDPLIGEALQIRLKGYAIQTNYDNVRLTASPD